MFPHNKASIHLIPDDAVFKMEYMAKVSNPDGQQLSWEPGRLLKYLVKNKHWSPLEMIDVVMYIETTRDIARQMLRHRSFFFQEFSQRYQEVSRDLIIRDARSQDSKNRQNSIDDMNEDDKDWWFKSQCDIENMIIKTYKDALDRGVAKEQARCILPEGMTMSRLYMKGNVRSWITYCDLRCSNGTQLEHQDIANKCKLALSREIPQLFEVDQKELDI
jgi:thymidylate synthase (FAD)